MHAINNIDLANCSPAELDAVIAQAQAAKAKARTSRIAALRAEFAERIAADGLKIEDVFPSSQKSASPRNINPPKYSNPDNASETWAGRGKRPGWFSANIQAGVTAESMLIQRVS